MQSTPQMRGREIGAATAGHSSSPATTRHDTTRHHWAAKTMTVSARGLGIGGIGVGGNNNNNNQNSSTGRLLCLSASSSSSRNPNNNNNKKNIKIKTAAAPVLFLEAPGPRFGLDLSCSLHPLATAASVHCRCSASSSSASSAFSDMDGSLGSSVFPLHRCKTLHLVRHAQGIHNVAGEKDFKAYLSYDLFDAHLTPLGWNQVDNLRKHVNASGIARKVDLVITSPLLRTMQTAVGVFGGDSLKDGVNETPLMVENAGNSGRSAISTLNCPPFIAVETCREHLGVHPCDKRRSISEYRPLFPAIDFSLIENDEDVLWKADIRETNDDLATRGMKFINWLWTRKEKEIAIVTHSGFLFHTLQLLGNRCHPIIKDEIGKHFANCELRSMVLLDYSAIGTDSLASNYPGKIPSGLDLPSDVAKEKLQEEKDSGNTQ